MTHLTRQELRQLYVRLDARRDAESLALREKLRALIAERADERVWGAKVFAITLPLSTPRLIVKGKHAGEYAKDSLAPTLNVYGSMKVWQRAALYKALDLRILAELHRWPLARPAPDPRAVRVTRRSSAKVDELSVDALGGKVPVDRLVRAGILRGDRIADLEREAVWQAAPPGKGSLLVEVFAIGLAPL